MTLSDHKIDLVTSQIISFRNSTKRNRRNGIDMATDADVKTENHTRNAKRQCVSLNALLNRSRFPKW